MKTIATSHKSLVTSLLRPDRFIYLPLVTRHSLLITFFSLFVTSVVFASGGESHGGSSIFKAYFWQIINFLILVFVLVFMLKKMDIKGYFSKRTELIEQSLKEAREAKELAQKALAEVETRLKVKDSEIAEIITAAKESGEREKARLIEEGEKVRARILEQTNDNINFEVKRAKESIKHEAATLAMELAEKKLRENLTKDEQIKLLDESLLKIEGKN